MTVKGEESELEKPQFWKKILSAFFYCLSSFLITTINKVVLTSYRFPSHQCLAVGQMLSTIIILYTLKRLRFISFPDLSSNIPSKIFPLPLLYLGNLWFGLGGTKSVSLPMLPVLRRSTVLITMIAQYYVTGTTVSFKEQLSVYIMMTGAAVAALTDLGFNYQGYTFVLVNNIFTAANTVYIKKKVEAKELGTYGIMFYNSLFMIAPLFTITWLSGDIDKSLEFDNAWNAGFILCFTLSCLMGFLLTLSTFLCTSFNSALTTIVMGALKNTMITYLGIFIGGDYKFTLPNFIGLNISISGSLFYSYQVFFTKQAKSADKTEDEENQIEKTKLVETATNGNLTKEDEINRQEVHGSQPH